VVKFFSLVFLPEEERVKTAKSNKSTKLKKPKEKAETGFSYKNLFDFFDFAVKFFSRFFLPLRST
jgi:hypothetical protein